MLFLGSSEVLGPIHGEPLPVRCEAHRHDLQGGDARHALQPQEDRHARIQVSYFLLPFFMLLFQPIPGVLFVAALLPESLDSARDEHPHHGQREVPRKN